MHLPYRGRLSLFKKIIIIIKSLKGVCRWNPEGNPSELFTKTNICYRIMLAFFKDMDLHLSCSVGHPGSTGRSSFLSYLSSTPVTADTSSWNHGERNTAGDERSPDASSSCFFFRRHYIPYFSSPFSSFSAPRKKNLPQFQVWVCNVSMESLVILHTDHLVSFHMPSFSRSHHFTAISTPTPTPCCIYLHRGSFAQQPL